MDFTFLRRTKILMNWLVKAYTFFPLILFIVMAQGLRRSHGHLRLKHLVLFTLGTLIFSYFVTKFREVKITEKILEKVLLGINILFLILLFAGHEMVYVQNQTWLSLIWGSLTIYGVYLFCDLLKMKGVIKVNYLSSKYFPLVLLVLNIFLVIGASPKPHIDVWEYSRLGAEYLLNGENPYTKYYPDIYNGKYDLFHGFPYWPTATWSFTAAHFIFGDVRFALGIFHILATVGLWKLASSFSFKNELKLGFACLWLTFPVTYFVMEQSWIDIFLLPSIFFTAYYLKEKKILGAAIWMGIACATKQYMIFMAILFLVYAIKAEGVKNATKAALAMAGVTVALSAPFLLWDFEAYYKNTVLGLLGLKARDDALSWVAYVLKFHKTTIPGVYTGALYLAVLGGLIFRILRTRLLTVETFYSSLFIIYMVVFLFGKQAFCNYYYLAASILLTYMVCYFGRITKSEGVQSPSL